MDGDVTQASAAPSADTDSSSGCWSSNDVIPCSSTGSPNGANRYQSVSERSPVVETDVDAVVLYERNRAAVTSNGTSGECFDCVGCHSDSGPLSRDPGNSAAACVSRGNGYCCSVQPLVTSPAVMATVSYDKNELPLPPPPPPSLLTSVDNNDGQSTRECRCGSDDDVTERDCFPSTDSGNRAVPSSSARCRQPPPLPPPRRTSSLVQQKNC